MSSTIFSFPGGRSLQALEIVPIEELRNVATGETACEQWSNEGRTDGEVVDIYRIGGTRHGGWGKLSYVHALYLGEDPTGWGPCALVDGVRVHVHVDWFYLRLAQASPPTFITFEVDDDGLWHKGEV